MFENQLIWKKTNEIANFRNFRFPDISILKYHVSVNIDHKHLIWL